MTLFTYNLHRLIIIRFITIRLIQAYNYTNNLTTIILLSINGFAYLRMVIFDAVNIVLHIYSERDSIQTLITHHAAEAARMV